MAGRPSNKKAEIYQYILTFIGERGYPPSMREICAAVKLRSPSTVHFHMKKLEEEGLISTENFKGRAISLPKKTLADKPENHAGQVPVLAGSLAVSPAPTEGEIEEYLPFDAGGLPGEHFALRIRDESMLSAGILPGDLVVVHRQENFRNEDIVAALFEGESTVRLLKRMAGGHVRLVSRNPNHPPIDGESCTLLGRVVAVVRKY